MLTRILTLAIAIASTTTAHATTEQDVYEKLWSKRAVDAAAPGAFLKPKAACVCMDGGPSNHKLGTLAKSGDAGFCGVPQFDGGGNLVVVNFCYVFEYIGK